MDNSLLAVRDINHKYIVVGDIYCFDHGRIHLCEYEEISIGFTIIFWLIDKRKIRLYLIGKPVYNIVLGCITGTIWLWLFSAFINSVMQEVLVRGYLYQMIKNNYNIVAAVIVSTGLFTFAHGGAFEAGILPVLNIITMSLFVTAVLEYTESLIAPIVIHFLWNGVGAIILGGVSLAEDYPHMFNMVISGNSIYPLSRLFILTTSKDWEEETPIWHKGE